MSRLDELKNDPAFRQAALAVRGAASTLSGRAMTHEEAELLVSFALATYANAGGLAEPSLSRLARFAGKVEPDASFESLESIGEFLGGPRSEPRETEEATAPADLAPPDRGSA